MAYNVERQAGSGGRSPERGSGGDGIPPLPRSHRSKRRWAGEFGQLVFKIQPIGPIMNPASHKGKLARWGAPEAEPRHAKCLAGRRWIHHWLCSFDRIPAALLQVYFRATVYMYCLYFTNSANSIFCSNGHLILFHHLTSSLARVHAQTCHNTS